MIAPEQPHDTPSPVIAQVRGQLRLADLVETLSAYDEAILMDRIRNGAGREHAADHVYAVLRDALDNAVTARLSSLKS